MKQIIAVSLGFVSSKLSRDLSSVTFLEGDGTEPAAAEDTTPEFGWSIQEAGCIKLKDNYNIFNFKSLERGAGEGFGDRGSLVSCLPDDKALDGVDPESDDFIADDCGGDSSSLFVYKVCQTEWQFPHRLFTVAADEDVMTRD